MYTDLKSIRQAVPGDLNKIRLILKNTKLPFEDIDRHIENFLVLEDAGEIIGTVGMEVYDGAVLLRSLAVIEKFQGKGFGLELYEAIISRAKELHIAQIYLLTETAEKFFNKQGFKKIPRNLVPHAIKQTTEFSALCPQSAACMALFLKE